MPVLPLQWLLPGTSLANTETFVLAAAKGECSCAALLAQQGSRELHAVSSFGSPPSSALLDRGLFGFLVVGLLA